MFPAQSLVPSKDIDAFWHQHILDTKKYAEDCDMIFGYFLHHFPYFGIRGEDDARSLKEAFADTKKLFLDYFGIDIMTSADDTSSRCGRMCGSAPGCKKVRASA